jgi:hypothetical protein
MELRCDHKKLGELTEGGVLEIKCSSRFCGPAGVVVIHRWSALTGERLSDKRFRDPVSPTARQQKEGARL